MVSYQLHKTIMCCCVNKALLRNIEQYVLNKLPNIISVPEGQNINISISIEDEFGTMRLNTIEDYCKETFSDKTNTLYFRARCYTANKFEMVIRFVSTWTPYIEITLEGDNSKETAVAIYSGIVDILSEAKAHHDIIHQRYTMIVIWALLSTALGWLLYVNNYTLAGIITSSIYVFAFCFYFTLVRDYFYPKIEFESRVAIRPRKILHWVISVLFSLLILGYLTKRIFG